MLKYHIQTSGRILHAQEISFNDIRTTLQALYAIFDNRNSLHTNAYDEAITTPTEESVRRAVAIQLIINRELGLNFTENPWQGSFVDRRADRPGRGRGLRGVRPDLRARRRARRDGHDVPARARSRREPLLRAAEARRHAAADRRQHVPARRTAQGEQIDERRADALDRRREATTRSPSCGPSRSSARTGATAALAHLQEVARARGNVFEALMDAVKVASLGQISAALYEVGGEYRRNM